MRKTSIHFGHPDGGFDLGYTSLGGCQLPFLMFTQAAFKAAFPIIGKKCYALKF